MQIILRRQFVRVKVLKAEKKRPTPPPTEIKREFSPDLKGATLRDEDDEVASLRSRREWVPARTSVPNASAKSRSGREKNHSRQLRRLRSSLQTGSLFKRARASRREKRSAAWRSLVQRPYNNHFS